MSDEGDRPVIELFVKVSFVVFRRGVIHSTGIYNFYVILKLELKTYKNLALKESK